MRLTALYSGKDSLMAHGTALTTIADNLANSNTTGFKESRTEFGDIIADSIGSLYGSELDPGNGVAASEVRVLHKAQGTLEGTDRDLDFAMQGSGYFVLGNGEQRYYTRAGNFNLDSEGSIRAASGEQVMGFTTASPTTLVPLTIDGAGLTATPTLTGTISGNLDADAPIVPVPAAAPATFTALNAATSFSTPVRVIDSLGAEHDVSLNFFHTAAGAWTVQAYVDGADVGGVAGTPRQVGTGTIAFDQNGLQAVGTPNVLAITPAWGNGAAAGAVNLDISKFQGLATNSGVTAINMDGNRAGALSSFRAEKDGRFFAVLDNGDELQLGSIGIATFVNEDGLNRVGDNRFEETAESGEASIGAGGIEGRGQLIGSSLENSTVDTASQFIDMIRYQRGYQAGSQVITTMSELLNSTIQII